MAQEDEPYRLPRCTEGGMVAAARAFHELMDRRRSVRDFASDPVPRQLIELAIRTASTAPSGANRQPWRFVGVSDAGTKRRIRAAAEAVERAFYESRRRDEEWLNALEPLGTTWEKPFLEAAPWLVVVFEERYGVGPDGSRERNYYVRESVGIACGLFIAAVHQMGLATLPYTPSPMGFLAEILERPANERPCVLFPVGHPASDAAVPVQRRKSLEQVASWKLGPGQQGH